MDNVFKRNLDKETVNDLGKLKANIEFAKTLVSQLGEVFYIDASGIVNSVDKTEFTLSPNRVYRTTVSIVATNYGVYFRDNWGHGVSNPNEFSTPEEKEAADSWTKRYPKSTFSSFGKLLAHIDLDANGEDFNRDVKNVNKTMVYAGFILKT